MRYVSVALITAVLLLLLINSYEEDLWAGIIIVAMLMLFPITLPIIGFWIYSFVKSIKGHTKSDKRFLWVQVTDLIILVAVIFLLNKPEAMCNADIMAEHYGKYGISMKELVNDTKSILPDTARLKIEFGKDAPAAMTNTQYPNKSQKENLKRQLKDMGCIGLEIGNRYGGKNWSTIRFRRIQMGMYSFRFYDKPLTRNEQDSINNDECLIVYNDSTVFEFGAGVFGTQRFIGKEEFMQKLHHSKND